MELPRAAEQLILEDVPDHREVVLTLRRAEPVLANPGFKKAYIRFKDLSLGATAQFGRFKSAAGEFFSTGMRRIDIANRQTPIVLAEEVPVKI